MKSTIIRSILLAVIGCFFLTVKGSSQNIDIDLLAAINPNQQPSSVYWKVSSQSTYPICIGVPTTLLLASYLHSNKNLRLQSVQLFGALAINTVATQSLKKIVRRQRPYNLYPDRIYPYKIETDYAFPSGHTSSAFALATSICINQKKWYFTIPAYAWAASVGYSRMYLGEHYPTDVLAGAALGIASAYLTNWINKKYFHPKKQP